MDSYSNPLIERYSSREMSYIFSPNFKFKTWRKLWIYLAESEQELGLPISDEQIEEMKANIDNIDYDVARKREKEVRHDVMAHIYTFGKVCPKAEPIIHLGATSAFVGDNTDLIQIKEGLLEVRKKMVALIKKMKNFSQKEKSRPTLGFTHYQPAQCTTVGKRGALWLQSFVSDFEELEFVIDSLRFRGVKGTTGTQASFMALFENDQLKVSKLDKLLSSKAGFDKRFYVTGQTYDRKTDYRVLSVLSSIAQSAHKVTNDIRLLQNLKEVEEPFEKNQIGSSAMAYKRNPMRSERVGSLAKFVISTTNSVAMTASTQWFERTLDDSANKRLSIPQAFLAIDSILLIMNNIFSGLVVYPKQIEKRLFEELPFMATENILMEAVKHGGNRQELHEVIRELSMEAAKEVKVNGKSNNLLDLIEKSEHFNLSKEDLIKVLDPSLYIGRAPEQVDEFISELIDPILEKYKDIEDFDLSLKV
ncbi:MAG: adenylosuccinate lyase [Candidatus Cloacimonadota bacterium]|nr:MAG: adenylosuccinate lyase [Candidatus Cloacimonadota bacterium]PIE77643.1 MAG: adenylosuccinate lyase [Candidatus Delongbacteria bacterium]